ncbi:hypothetical protein IU459_16145 [Nocardia amamiensis]|uniref:Uncharacterized protein n=1 Tax=Nocardia amamiensis TaxID=404578 RepID=A0ABS0CR53_9NOCA|nr:hypothetical protein [Nocardia amamiensis]MBF6299061.1 hypothetical protein [Nocardia amamiensis]
MTVLTGATVIYALLPDPPRPSLELAALAVAQPEQIDGEVSGSVGMAPKPFSIGATNADITLKNNGSAPALITAANVQVLFAEQLDDCAKAGGGPSVITGHYTAKLPTPLPSRPFAVKRDMRFEVKGGSVDRLSFSVGPEQQNISSPRPYLIVAHVALVHDGSASLDVGNIAIVTNTNAIRRQAAEPVDIQCVEKNSALLDSLYEIQAIRSTEIDHLRDRYREILTPETVPAQQRCRNWPESSQIPQLCATYRQRELSVSVHLTEPPVVDKTMIVVRVDTDDPAQKYQVVVALQTIPGSSPGPRWSCSGLGLSRGTDDASGPCSQWTTLDMGTDGVLTLKTQVYPYFTHRMLTLTADLKQQTGRRTNVLVASTPNDKGLTVERGY